MALALPGSALARGPFTIGQGPVLDPLPAPAMTHVMVGPRTIGTHTNVLVRFRQPITTGYNGAQRRIEALQISGPSRPQCIGSRRVVLAATQAGRMVRHRLHPRWLGGRWCTGIYRGRVTYQIEPACVDPGPVRATSVACPMYIMAPRTLATFHFRVTAR